MRSIWILAATMAALLAANASLADDYEVCKNKCSADRDARNGDCPAGYDSARDQCLQDSRETYLACVHSCPPPAQAPGPSTMTRRDDEAAPRQVHWTPRHGPAFPPVKTNSAHTSSTPGTGS